MHPISKHNYHELAFFLMFSLGKHYNENSVTQLNSQDTNTTVILHKSSVPILGYDPYLCGHGYNNKHMIELME